MNANEQLLEAVDNREVEAVKAALDAGADANAKDSYGIPALHRAMANSDIVKMLLEHGADPDIRDNDGIVRCIMIAMKSIITTAILPVPVCCLNAE
jgi:ankyrin repeat protein